MQEKDKIWYNGQCRATSSTENMGEQFLLKPEFYQESYEIDKLLDTLINANLVVHFHLVIVKPNIAGPISSGAANNKQAPISLAHLGSTPVAYFYHLSLLHFLTGGSGITCPYQSAVTGKLTNK